MGYDPEVLKRVRQMNIMDDMMFQKMAEDPGFCEELISTILEKPVSVVETIPQNSIKNLQGRSVILDALCSMEDGQLTNVEVQKADDDDHIRRMRYNSACMIANITNPGDKFEKVPDVCSIFISKFDVFQSNKTIYHVDKMVRETGMHLEDGHRIIYVNTKVNDGSDIAQLMQLFVDNDAYDFKKFPRCSNRKMQFKMTEEGEAGMCDLVEEYAQKVAKKAAEEAAAEAAKKAAEETAELIRKTTIIKMLKRGDTIEEIHEIYSDVGEEEIRKMEQEDVK